MARIIGKGYSYDDVLIVPKYNNVKSRKDVHFKTRLTRNYSIDIPIVAASMDTVCEAPMAIALGKLGGIGVVHRFLTIESQVNEIKKVVAEKVLSAAAIGIKDFETRVPALVSAGTKILVLDIAHSHSKYVGNTIEWIKQHYPNIDIMVGNIATKDAAEYLYSKGADAVKVGIGPGSLCTTRIMSGAGIPQVTAIMDVYEATQNRIPICADGGIRYPGDITKAIGAGADTVMIGYLFAGTEECPGKIIEKDGEKLKQYRGMASYDATIQRLSLEGKKEEAIHVEGEVTRIPLKGSVKPIVEKLLVGLASGMTYMGASEMEKLKGKADFIEISPAGYKESTAHALNQ